MGSGPRPTICLSMIVRDEAHVVTECLGSVAPLVDTWVVVDTGSEDATPEVVEEFFAERGLPGELHRRPWRDFGTNRSEALDLCRGRADYALVMDADDVVVGTPPLDGLTADAYLLRMSEGIEFWRALLLRLDRGWRFEGVVHEYPACHGDADIRRLEGDYRVLARRLGARNRDPDKYRRDARLLEEAHAADPDDPRTVFYLAQSRRDAGEDEAALRWYRERASMGGWDEEVFLAHLEAGHALSRLGRWPEALDAYLTAWQARPTRAEPLVALARHYRGTGEWELAHHFARVAAELALPEGDLLFVDTDAHRWQALDELAVSAFWTGRHTECFAVSTRLLDGPALPDDHWERVLANRDFTVDAVKPETLRHPAEVVARLVEPASVTRTAEDGPEPEPEPEVTFTITTCRRPALFEATMDSFLNCCADVERIGRWLWIDDGSEPEDLARMAERYPFLERIEKARGEAGHAGSMERLRAEVTSPWWLHLEDDWHFFVPGRYVERAIDVLESDPALGQVLFNRNYGETLDDRRLSGGEVARTATGRRYRRHVHHPAGSATHDEYLASFGPDARANTWWPHFSLRPSMVRTAATAEVGAFDPGAGHFELDYAERWSAAGWRSAFLDQITCLHLGPRTFDRGADRAPNAYDLAGREQFAPAPTTVALVPNWTTPGALLEQWSRQTPAGDGRWGQVQLVAEPAGADLVLVLNHPPPGAELADPARTIVAPMEPTVAQARWSPEQRRDLLQVRDHARYGNLWEWHLARTYAQLRDDPVAKTADLSAVVSDRDVTVGQRLRLAFLHQLEDHGVPIDVYGRCEGQGFAGFRGRLPDFDKSAGILPYRYTVAAENHAEAGYVTEKLVDAVLGEALCLYWGAPDAEDLVDPDVLVRLPLEDPDAARRLLTATIAEGTWERRLPAIRAEKRRLLDEGQALPVLDRVARGWRRAQRLRVEVLNLDRRADRWAALERHLTDRAPELWARCRRRPAVDGLALTRDAEIDRLFAHNDFGWRRAVIGCALSHLEVWREVAAGAEPVLVLEDDVTVAEGGWGELVEALGLLDAHHPDFDLAYLGFSPWPGRPPRARPEVGGPLRIGPLPWREYQGGSFAYLISPKGAAHLVGVAESEGMRWAGDEFVRRSGEGLEVLEVHPHLVTAPLAGPRSGADSDIQADHAPVPAG